MSEAISMILEDFVANLRISIIAGAYTRCNESWRDIDYLPDYNKFYLIEDGEGWLKIGNEEYYPKPGQLFLMPAGVLQSYSAISSRPFTKYWCHFTMKLGDVNFFDVLGVPCYVNAGDFDKTKMLFQQLLDEHGNNTLSASLRKKAILLQIVSAYLDATGIQEIKFRKISSLDKFNRVLSYIQDHIQEEISMGEMAERLFYSPSYFTRMFKKYTGLTPTQYINKTRLDRARLLLKTTDLQVSEIAGKTGFCDIYYFSKCFKGYTGFSPTDYRAI